MPGPYIEPPIIGKLTVIYEVGNKVVTYEIPKAAQFNVETQWEHDEYDPYGNNDLVINPPRMSSIEFTAAPLQDSEGKYVIQKIEDKRQVGQ